ncbi:MarR family winged helix-turn-helix transcriptional regulator [Psychrobacillus soli]|uniref:Winged helix DNA-binding protein n=1 Tax=Psychrobacillus soli TaxID=1543965 RepID=A0A544TFW3_9BACI|nr:winged helix DNA-binding protein [Psychrobacillus soli]TQR16286.1 winged helix DNA-binding protein [Psychrobacillus soli]
MESYKELFNEYIKMYRPYINQLNALLVEFNLTTAQWSIMNFVFREGAKTIGDISLYQNVEKPTTTKLVQKLIELGYVEIYAGDDKRVKFVQLSNEGLAVYSKVRRKIDHFQNSLLEGISEDDRLIVVRILKGISDKIETYKG